MTGTKRDPHFCFLIPVHDDWPSLRLLLDQLQNTGMPASVTCSLLIVDDASTQPLPAALAADLARFREVRLLVLRRNLEHQRAICIGLAYVQENLSCDGVIVMDGDGEDRPQDVPRLIDAFLGASPSRVVFAGRLRRSEGLLFRLGYWTFRQVHRFLVGIPVQFGNFSIIPASFLETLVVVSESWNHYAAAVLKARLPYAVVPTERGVRLAGQSHMRFPSLVAHGLNALSVFGEIICARALVFCVVMLCLLLAGSGGLIVFVKTGALSLSPWVLAGAAIVLVLVLQGIMGSFFLALILMFNRNNAGFLPIRDYRFFIRSAKCLQGELRSS